MKIAVADNVCAHAREGRWHANHALHRVSALGIGAVGSDPTHVIVAAFTYCGETLTFPVLSVEDEVPTHLPCRRRGCFCWR